METLAPPSSTEVRRRRSGSVLVAVGRWAANLVGAAGAAYFAYVTLRAFQETRRPVGLAFLAEQLLVVVLYLVRRPAQTTTRRFRDWALAFGGTFTPVLLRPGGAHPVGGLWLGLGLQLVGLSLCTCAFLSLNRSFGFAAADRGLVVRGPYAVVRHPVYAGYVVLQTGYLVQSLSVRNVVVVVTATAFNAGRAVVEDRLLASHPRHAAYCGRVRWRIVPGIW